MGTINETIEINASPDVVWAIAGDIGGVAAWFPGIEFVQMDDDVRIAKFTSGLFVVERIVDRSDEAREFTYVIIGGEFPIDNYRTRLKVEPHDGGGRVTWSATFDARDPERERELTDAIAADYRGGLEGLRRVSEQQAE
jgi:carbon monoxide dehydrogenase subunit G